MLPIHSELIAGFIEEGKVAGTLGGVVGTNSTSGPTLPFCRFFKSLDALVDLFSNSLIIVSSDSFTETSSIKTAIIPQKKIRKFNFLPFIGKSIQLAESFTATTLALCYI